jgi:hypothetical protein
MNIFYLHIGFHETATTTFQQIYGSNRDVLKMTEVLYPQFTYPPEKGNR